MEFEMVLEHATIKKMVWAHAHDQKYPTRCMKGLHVQGTRKRSHQ